MRLLFRMSACYFQTQNQVSSNLRQYFLYFSIVYFPPHITVFLKFQPEKKNSIILEAWKATMKTLISIKRGIKAQIKRKKANKVPTMKSKYIHRFEV